MLKALQAVLVAVWVLWQPTGVHAQDVTPLKVVTGEEYFPFVSSAMANGGLSVDLIHRVLDRAGIPFTVDVLPWNRAYHLTRIGAYDLTFPFVRTRDRSEAMILSEPLSRMRVLLVSQSEAPIESLGRTAILEKTLCNPLGFALNATLEYMVQNNWVFLEEPRSMDDCYNMLAFGRVDFLVANDILHFWLLESLPSIRPMLHVAPQPIAYLGHHAMIRKDHPQGEELMAKFNAALLDVQEEDWYLEMFPAPTVGN